MKKKKEKNRIRLIRETKVSGEMSIIHVPKRNWELMKDNPEDNCYKYEEYPYTFMELFKYRFQRKRLSEAEMKRAITKRTYYRLRYWWFYSIVIPIAMLIIGIILQAIFDIL